MSRAVVLLGLCSVVVAACDLAREAGPVDASGGPDGQVPINGDLVPAIGGPTTLDIACWNVEFFPKSNRTIQVLADLIVSLDLDLVAFEEIASVDGWNQLLARLPEYRGVLSSHRYTPLEYQKLGFLYRHDLVTLGPSELLFGDDSFNFPRPPMKVHVEAAGLSFDAIGVHLKAGTAVDDADRRAVSIQVLESYVRGQIEGGGEDEVIVLGDYNEVITSDSGRQVFAPMYGAPDRFRFLTEDVAGAGAYSFIPAGVILDHIVTTTALDDELGAARAVIPQLDDLVLRYDAEVSDHLPVIVSIPQP